MSGGKRVELKLQAEVEGTLLHDRLYLQRNKQTKIYKTAVQTWLCHFKSHVVAGTCLLLLDDHTSRKNCKL